MHDSTTTATPSQGRRLLTPAQAAEHLALSTSTLANWRCAGAGPPSVKVGGRVRYRLAELDAWVDAEQGDHHDTGGAA